MAKEVLNINTSKTQDGQPVQHWQESVQIYSRSTPVVTQRNCFAVLFTNLGDDVVTVNSIDLFPNSNPATGSGDSISLAGHKNDLYTGSINISFAGVGVAPKVRVIQLCYNKSY